MLLVAPDDFTPSDLLVCYDLLLHRVGCRDVFIHQVARSLNCVIALV